MFRAVLKHTLTSNTFKTVFGCVMMFSGYLAFLWLSASGAL